MAKQNTSAWSGKMTAATQFQTVRALFRFMKPYAKYFYGALILAAAISVVNVLLPRLLQTFMNQHLHRMSPTWRLLIVFALLYFTITLVKAVAQFFSDYWFMSAAEFIKL